MIMKLEAMVPRSVFNDILETLRKKELVNVRMSPLGHDYQDVVSITADVSPDRMLEIAQLTGATIANPETDHLAEFDRLVIENHLPTGGWRFDSYNGQVNIWLEDCLERL